MIQYPGETAMLVKDSKKSLFVKASDDTILSELFHPFKHPRATVLPYSLAYAKIHSGKSSRPHRLRTSSELYFILQGEARMHVDEEEVLVTPGVAILVPPGATQYLENQGSSDLTFLCIVSPPWKPDDETLV
jgi:mannose-6-phosphate isomerase-like protein (cupin superfamily)